MDLRERCHSLSPSPQRRNHDKRFLWDTLHLKRLFPRAMGTQIRPFF